METEKRQVTVTAKWVPEERYWLVSAAPEPNKRLVTEARRLADVERRAREGVAVLLEVPVARVSVDIELDLPEAFEVELDRMKGLREEAEHAVRAAQQAQAETARALVGAGLTMRDAGRVLGVSHSRIMQLVGRRSAA